jgi:hypothetical protein
MTVFSGNTSTLTVYGATTGGSIGAILNLKTTSSIRARGVLHQVDDTGAEWFAGIGYNQHAYTIGYDLSGGQGEYAANNVFRVTTGGNVYIEGGLYAKGEAESYDTSDIRFKEILNHLDPKETTSALMSLDTIRYRHKVKDKIELGVIYHQVYNHFPENTKEDPDGMGLVHYGKMMVPMLTMLQRHEIRIKDLEHKLAECNGACTK